MMHFVCTFLITRTLSVRLIAIEGVRDNEKIVYIKSIVENGWWEAAYLSSYPLDPPLVISYRNHQKNLAYFSHLAPLVLFFFTKRQSQRGGGAWHNAPPKYAPADQPQCLSIPHPLGTFLALLGGAGTPGYEPLH